MKNTLISFLFLSVLFLHINLASAQHKKAKTSTLSPTVSSKYFTSESHGSVTTNRERINYKSIVGSLPLLDN